MSEQIFNYPTFVEIKKGVCHWFAPVQDACKEYIRIDHQGLPEHVPDKYILEREDNTIALDVMKTSKTKDVIMRTYSTNGYTIYITNL